MVKHDVHSIPQTMLTLTHTTNINFHTFDRIAKVVLIALGLYKVCRTQAARKKLHLPKYLCLIDSITYIFNLR